MKKNNMKKFKKIHKAFIKWLKPKEVKMEDLI